MMFFFGIQRDVVEDAGLSCRSYMKKNGKPIRKSTAQFSTTRKDMG
jgi:hypothetical protein